MRSETRDLPVPATQTQGAWVNVQDLWDKWVIVTVIGTAQLRVQGRVGTGDPVDLGGLIVANGAYEFPENVDEVRIDRVVVGVGTPVAKLKGRDARTD